MSISTSTDLTSRDHIITTMLKESAGMIYNMARNVELDYEDAVQESALVMLEVWPKIPEKCTNLKSYLHRCVRNRLANFRRRVIDEMSLSLDEPIAQGQRNETTRADMLVAPMQTQDNSRVDHIIETIHAGLRDCLLEEQQYVARLFGMNAFTPVAPTQRRKGNGLKPFRDMANKRDASNMRRSVLTIMRKNPQVQALLPA